MTDPGRAAFLAGEEIRAAVYRLTGGTGDPRSAYHDPLAALRVLTSLRAAISQPERDAARRARENGKSWAEIGVALGLPADLTFGRFASDLGSGPCLAWTCRSCGQMVTDRGYDNRWHAEDAETGHAEGCERFAATVAGWDAQWGESSDDD